MDHWVRTLAAQMQGPQFKSPAPMERPGGSQHVPVWGGDAAINIGFLRDPMQSGRVREGQRMIEQDTDILLWPPLAHV